MALELIVPAPVAAAAGPPRLRLRCFTHRCTSRLSDCLSSGGRRQLPLALEARCTSLRNAEDRIKRSRRDVLILLLSASASTLAPVQIFGIDGGHDAHAAESPSFDVSIEAQEVKVGEDQTIGDLFGFDGLGKTSEEYALSKVVALAQAGDGAVLFLGVDGFELPLQLVVGPAEAMAVLTAVQERKSRRPVTHEAWGLSLAAVGWKVDRVVITGNEKDVFYSSVVLSNLSQLLAIPSSEQKSVDMRPSDGIALALRCRAPLFVRIKVAEDILGKDDLAGKVQVDPLKEPGLQANAGVWHTFVDNLVFTSRELKHDSTLHC